MFSGVLPFHLLSKLAKDLGVCNRESQSRGADLDGSGDSRKGLPLAERTSEVGSDPHVDLDESDNMDAACPAELALMKCRHLALYMVHWHRGSLVVQPQIVVATK